MVEAARWRLEGKAGEAGSGGAVAVSETMERFCLCGEGDGRAAATLSAVPASSPVNSNGCGTGGVACGRPRPLPRPRPRTEVGSLPARGGMLRYEGAACHA